MSELSEEQKRQLKNCYEVIRQYQEKQKNNPDKNKFEKKQIIKKEDTNTNSSFSSRPVKNGHQRIMGGNRKDDIHSYTNYGTLEKNNKIKMKKIKLKGLLVVCWVV